MKIEKVELKDLKNSCVMLKTLGEVRNYAFHLGYCETVKNIFHSGEQLPIEFYMKDYVESKFGVFIEDTPKKIIKTFREGFYSGCNSSLSIL